MPKKTHYAIMCVRICSSEYTFKETVKRRVGQREREREKCRTGRSTFSLFELSLSRETFHLCHISARCTQPNASGIVGCQERRTTNAFRESFRALGPFLAWRDVVISNCTNSSQQLTWLCNEVIMSRETINYRDRIYRHY